MFHGFSPETMDFLWGIRMNNERDWFLAHKHEYTQYLYEPMKALGNEVFQPFQEVPGLELKVSRIYRDARMHRRLHIRRAYGSVSAVMSRFGGSIPRSSLSCVRREPATGSSCGSPAPMPWSDFAGIWPPGPTASRRC